MAYSATILLISRKWLCWDSGNYRSYLSQNLALVPRFLMVIFEPLGDLYPRKYVSLSLLNLRHCSKGRAFLCFIFFGNSELTWASRYVWHFSASWLYRPDHWWCCQVPWSSQKLCLPFASALPFFRLIHLWPVRSFHETSTAFFCIFHSIHAIWFSFSPHSIVYSIFITAAPEEIFQPELIQSYWTSQSQLQILSVWYSRSFDLVSVPPPQILSFWSFCLQ